MHKIKHSLDKLIKLKPSLVELLTMASLVLFFVKQWLNPFPQYGGDWHYVFLDRIKENLRLPQLWDLAENYGGNNAARISLNLLDGMQSILTTAFGFNFKLTEIILWFIPFLVFGLLGSFLLAKKLFKSRIAAAVAAFFYTINTYTLTLFAEAGHINILVAYSTIPFIVYSLILVLEQPKFKHIFFYLIFLSICFSYDLRIAYVSIFAQLVFVIYYLVAHHSKRYLLSRSKAFVLTVLTFILINLFWIVPIIITPKDNIIAQGYDKPFWVYNLSYQNFWNGIFPQHPFWNYNGISYFHINNIQPEFYILTAVLILGITLARRHKQKALLVPLFTIWFLGTMLVSGSNAPFGPLYIWLFEHFPGFFMFREPQKFYALVFLPYSLLLGLAVERIGSRLSKKSYILNVVFKIALTALFIATLWPAFAGKLNHNFISRDVPLYAQEITDLNTQNKEFYRTLWIPQFSKAAYKTDQNPRLDYGMAFDTFFPNTTDADKAFDYINTAEFEYLLQKSSVRYIVLTEEEEVSKWFKADDYKKMKSALDQSKYLKKIDSQDYSIYEYKGYSEFVYATDNALITNYTFLDDKSLNKLELKPKQTILSTIDLNNYEVFQKSSVYLNLNDINHIKTIEPGKFTSSNDLKLNSSAQIYKLSGYNYYNVSVNKDQLVFTPVADAVNEQNNSGTLTLELKTAFAFDPKMSYILAIGDQQYKLSDKIENVMIANDLHDEIKIYQQDTSILHEDFSTSKVLNIGNCRNENHKTLEENGILYKYQDNALKLSANTNLACIFFDFNTTNETKLIELSIDYKNYTGDLPQLCFYNYTLDKCTVKESLYDAVKDKFQTSTYRLPLLDNQTKYGLYIYADGGSQKTENYYDNILISGYKLALDTKLTTQKTGATQQAGVYNYDSQPTLTITHPIISPLIIPNNSFEDNINYAANVKDCNNADKSDLNTNAIKAQQVSPGTDSQSALALSGKNHMACYDLLLGKLSKNYQYIFTLDYFANLNTMTRICIFNTETQKCEENKVYAITNNWENVKFTFTPSQNSYYQIYLYSFSTNSDGNYYQSNFDNLQLYRLPKDFINSYLLFSDNTKGQKTQVPDLTYEVISPTEIKVNVRHAVNPYFLNLSTTYSSGWNITSSSAPFSATHLKSNTYMNSWLINTTGDYTINISFSNQKWENLAIFISISVFSAISLILILQALERPKSAKEV
jgi:hypothetical protein